jgi:alpha-ketoglutarate-dependent taurine dioxygenase
VAARDGQATVLYAEVASASGGETHFCDMYGAYERLSPAWKARLEGCARSTTSTSRARAATPRTRSPTSSGARAAGRPSCDPHARGDRSQVRVPRRPRGVDRRHAYDEGRALIEEVNAMIVHDDLTYRHRWSPGS